MASALVNQAFAVEERPILRYIETMAKTAPKAPSDGSHQVRNTKTGEFLTVRGMGALKGHLTLQKGVDLTKPIASQALSGKASEAGKR